MDHSAYRARWRALWIARDYRLAYTYGEHVLLALLENPTPEVAAILKALGEEPSALLADVRRFAEALVETRRTSDGWGENTEIENAAYDHAREGGYYEAHPEHFLLAITSPLRHGYKAGVVVEAGRFLTDRGIRAEAIREHIRPPEPGEQVMRPYEPPMPGVRLTEGWKAAAARCRYDRPFFSLGEYDFTALIAQYREAGEWALLAHLYETLAASEMLARRTVAPDANTRTVAQRLIMAAHLLRRAGDHGRARLVAQRAIHELGTVHTDGRPNPASLPEPIHVAFVLEMMGDAAICFDPGLARTYWVRALEEFRYIDLDIQTGEYLESGDHGWYLDAIHRQFLSIAPRDHSIDGEARVAAKIEKWTGGVTES